MFKGKFRFSDRMNFQTEEEEVNDFESLCQLVEMENRRCLKENTTAQVTILAVDKKERFVYERRLFLPFQNAVEMELLDFFDAKKQKKKKHVETPNPLSESKKVNEGTEVPLTETVETRVSKRMTKRKSLLSIQKLNTSKLKVAIFVAFIFLSLGGIYVTVTSYLQGNTQSKEEKVVPTLENLLKKSKYLEAAQHYEDKIDEIEDVLFQTIINGEEKKKVSIDTLKKFERKYPSVNGGFDLAFLRGEYQVMTKKYDQQPYHFGDDEMRLNLVGYAYLKLEQIDKAKAIAAKVEDVALSKKIASYELYKKQLAEKEKSIEGVKPTNESELKKYNQTLDEIYELKQKIANL